MTTDAYWRQAGSCASTGFPDLWEGATPEAEQTAKWYCRRCPVQLRCLQDALETDERYGVRGGLSSDERVALGIPAQRTRPARVEYAVWQSGKS